MGARTDRWDEPKRKCLEHIQKQTGVTFELEGHAARWASGPTGTIGIMASATRDGNRWWLSLDENEFAKRDPLGIVLLCQSENTLLEFGLSRQRVLALLPRLGRDRARGERKFNLVRQRGRYWLQVPSEDSVDVTDSQGDLSWLREDGSLVRSDLQALGGSANTAAADSARAEERTFFARVRRGMLEPLDPTGLPEGALVRVRATTTDAAPSLSALRLIVAAGGPANLPKDFAERHDDYAHAARK